VKAIVALRHSFQSPHRPERVVVVGAGGFVGAAIADRLERDATEVLRLRRSDVDLLAADAADRLSGLLRDGDVLVAAAAIAPCKTALQLRDNMTLALAIVQAAAARVKLSHVVNISSDAVYADCEAPLTETASRAPETLHGVMHLARELMFVDAFGGMLATLRPTLIYGVGDPHNGYGPNRFRRLAASGKPIVLFGEGEERRDHVAIDDVAEIAARVIFRRSIGALNVATGEVASFRDIAQMMAALSDHPVAISGSPRSGPMPHNGYRPFDIAACRAAFPDFSYTVLNDGLARAIRDEAAASGKQPAGVHARRVRS
jgi:nucleoside-diphosphate-sugar epimerase